jgi:radical SAM superfamily enzyme YgiQ (UPF0313 family)
MLDLMRRAGFIELALGIEFLDDESFVDYGKKSTRDDIVRAIANIRAHGIGVRGLFIVGTDHDRRGVGRRIARFVAENGIHGALVQSMFFTPALPFFEENPTSLIDQNWTATPEASSTIPQPCAPTSSRRKSSTPADASTPCPASCGPS